MVGIVDQSRMLIVKSRLRLVEAYAMLPEIGRGLALIPFETERIHTYIVRTKTIGHKAVMTKGSNGGTTRAAIP